jgi:hypothetical protein
MGGICFSSECYVMGRGGLSPLCSFNTSYAILDVTGEFNRIESIEPCDADGLVALHVHDCLKYDCCSLDTPYLTYDKHTGEAAYVLARYLVAGMVLLSVKPTMKYAKTRYSMDMQDLVTGFGLRNHVTLGKTQYTMRAIHSIVKMDAQPKRCLSVKLKHTVTMQTANGIVKTWSV